MGISKVVHGGRTLIDLTGDSVTPLALSTGVTAHNAAGERIVGTGGVLKFQNVSLPPSLFSWEGSRADYPYRASVPLAGVTAEHIPAVTIGADVDSPVFCPEAAAYNGGIYLYAACLVNRTFTISAVYCFR